MKLNLRSVDLNLLPVFVAVVEAGQLSRAADQLGMSQPAVSAALQRLRLTVDDPLFTRTRAGLVPTPRARELYQQVGGNLQALAQAMDPGLQFDPSASMRAFRLIAVDYFEMLMVGPLLSRLRTHSDGVSLQVQAQAPGWSQRLLAGEADFALDTEMIEDERLAAEVVTHEELSVVARTAHPTVQGALTLEQFLAAEHAVLPAREQRVLPLDQILGRPGWRRRVGAQVSQYSSLLAVVAASDLVATVPRRLARRYAGAYGVQVLAFPVPVPPVPIYLIWPRALGQDPAHIWLRTQLAEAFALINRQP